jgi:hypothetical protein
MPRGEMGNATYLIITPTYPYVTLKQKHDAFKVYSSTSLSDILVWNGLLGADQPKKPSKQGHVAANTVIRRDLH